MDDGGGGGVYEGFACSAPFAVDAGCDFEESASAFDVDFLEQCFWGEDVGGGGVDDDRWLDFAEDGEQGFGGGDVGFVIGGAGVGVACACQIDDMDGCFFV